VSTVTGPELNGNPAANETISSTAAAANHFSCSRSSPEDRANLTTTAAPPTASAAITQTAGANATAGPPSWPGEVTNGRAQTWVAVTSAPTMASANAPLTNHAAGRHRRERRRPVGNSSKTNASMAMGMTQIQLDSQAATRPPGQDPGAATSACCAY